MAFVYRARHTAQSQRRSHGASAVAERVARTGAVQTRDRHRGAAAASRHSSCLRLGRSRRRAVLRDARTRLGAQEWRSAPRHRAREHSLLGRRPPTTDSRALTISSRRCRRHRASMRYPCDRVRRRRARSPCCPSSTRAATHRTNTARTHDVVRTAQPHARVAVQGRRTERRHGCCRVPCVGAVNESASSPISSTRAPVSRCGRSDKTASDRRLRGSGVDALDCAEREAPCHKTRS
jgi:hypothetical protein